MARMTYRDWEELNQEEEEIKKEKYRLSNKRMAAYYKRQRKMGYVLSAIGIIAVAIGCFNWWIPLITVGSIMSLTGLYCTVTRRMVYIDRYYFECQDRMRGII